MRACARNCAQICAQTRTFIRTCAQLRADMRINTHIYTHMRACNIHVRACARACARVCAHVYYNKKICSYCHVLEYLVLTKKSTGEMQLKTPPLPEELLGNPPLIFSERFRGHGDMRPSDSCKAHSRVPRNLISSNVEKMCRKKWKSKMTKCERFNKEGTN